MLRALSIENVVLIEKLSLEFSQGLIALTGETGAGKSIILDSLSLVLGARADSGLIRAGADGARVTAEFDISKNHPLWDEVDADPNEALIVSRTLSREGKSRANVNDRPVTIEALRRIGAALVDIHSQFESHALLEPSQHRVLLDKSLPNPKAKDDVVVSWDKWQALVEQRNTLEAVLEKARLQKSQWEADLEVLNELDPQAGEEEQLLEQRKRAQNAGRMDSAFQESMDALNGGDTAADKALNKAWKALSRLPEDKDVQEVQAQIDQAIAAVRDASRCLDVLRGIYGGMPDLEKVDDRLHDLRGAARRLNCGCDELPSLKTRIETQLSSLQQDDAAVKDLDKNIAVARDAYVATAALLTKARAQQGKTMTAQIMKELPPLKLERAAFSVDMNALEDKDWGPHGVERLQFMAAMNAGQSPSPLHKTASGGELSRLLLAIKMVLAESQPVLVFDEIDQGVGGATAAAIGERLKRLAEGRQVIVVTHSAQVAASADAHFVVQKAAETKSTRVAVTELKGAAARRDEVARMLAGSVVTNEAKAAADKLLEGSL